MNSLKHFFYNCYYVIWLAPCSVVRSFFKTNKRSGVAVHEEKKKLNALENAEGDYEKWFRERTGYIGDDLSQSHKRLIEYSDGV